MNMEFLVAFTLDEQSKVYIETFAFYDSDDIRNVCEKIPLCELINFESIEVITDPKRQLISFIMYNTVSLLLCLIRI